MCDTEASEKNSMSSNDIINNCMIAVKYPTAC